MAARSGSVAAVVGLYTWSRVRGLICSDKSGIDSIFLHGPALIGLVLGELLKRMASDLNSIAPYTEFSKDHQPGTKSNSGSLLLTEGPSWMTFFQATRLSRVALALDICALQILAIWATVMIGSFSSSAFSLGVVTMSKTTQPFYLLDIETLAPAMENTSVLSLGAMGISNADFFGEPPWINSMEPGSVLTNPSWAGILPFYPADAAQATAETGASDVQTWTANTQFLYSSVECTKLSILLDVFRISVDQGEVTVNDLTSWICKITRDAAFQQPGDESLPNVLLV